jgi:hypothetical protein
LRLEAPNKEQPGAVQPNVAAAGRVGKCGIIHGPAWHLARTEEPFGQLPNNNSLKALEVVVFSKILESLHGSKIDALARTFRRLGRTGFWLQVVLGSFPVVLMGYVFTFTGGISGTRAGLPIVEYVTVANLLVLLFTTIWFYRYVGLSRKIADPLARPSETSVLRTVWTGLVASSIGTLFSMVVLLLEVGQLLFYFLAAPQGGIPAIQTTPTTLGGQSSWVSTVDVASLMALLLTLTAEVIALIFGLWLLFRTTQAAGEFPEATQG